MPNISECSPASCRSLRLSARTAVAKQKFISEELLRDGRARETQRARGVPFRRKNNGKVPASLASTEVLRTTKNAEKSKKPGKRGEWPGDGWNSARISSVLREVILEDS